MMVNEKLPVAGYRQSIKLLNDAATQNGFIASTDDKTNYYRVWARDGVICGLASLLSAEDHLIDCFKKTLNVLAENQGSQGQIPSNIAFNKNNEVSQVSYGSVAGRVDTIPWFIIGLCNYCHYTSDYTLIGKWNKVISNGLNLLKSWEFNNKNLLYVPQAGDWADEYIFHGYVLYDQLLRLWALKTYARLINTNSLDSFIEDITDVLLVNYWPDKHYLSSKIVYHRNAYKQFLEENEECSFALPSFSPGGYYDQFDPLSNALAILLNLFTKEQHEKIISYGQQIMSKMPEKMIPIFWPPIYDKNPLYIFLKSNHSFEFKNKPHHYHNGGLWPMVNGWWGCALKKCAKNKEAHTLLENIYGFNKKKQWGFYEYGESLKGHPHGTAKMAWSAAGAVMLCQYLNSKCLFMG